MAVGAAVSDRVAARVGAHRSVGVAMVLMGGGIISVSFFGQHLSFAGLMPSFAVIGIGGGLTIPLVSSILNTMPADRTGIASGVFNASREVAGLLGITVIGVVLTARQGALTRAGAGPLQAFLGGYRLGLIVAGALVVAGGLVAWLALRAGAPEASATALRPPAPPEQATELASEAA
jgi:MFS family permease